MCKDVKMHVFDGSDFFLNPELLLLLFNLIACTCLSMDYFQWLNNKFLFLDVSNLVQQAYRGTIDLFSSHSRSLSNNQINYEI